ncbi:hypothetical protein Pcinc_003847 [Petrolisthes cinctipes]|uniref:Protein Wnt n=1 Tax=Petrolisthes cinctipes TaxID=88211 RepID=A0AAE1GI48_PETCI|nr:hypothetical protein Pcinc_003847 [Petrolisthes cinctipes]
MTSLNYTLHVVVVTIFYCLVGLCHGNLGISSRRKVDQALLTTSIHTLNFTDLDLRTLCEHVGVQGVARGACHRSKEMAEALVEAAVQGAWHCRHLLHYHRWNCSLGKARRRIVRKAYPETALVQSVSAASVAHVVSRRCALGRLSRCSCDTAHDDSATESWRWGGCGDNTRYGTRMAKRFFMRGTGKERPGKGQPRGSRQRIASLSSSPPKAFTSTGKDFKSRIDVHNALIGIRTVMEGSGRVCKCHGVSGSCSVETCWVQLPHFSTTASTLFTLYRQPVLATTTNQAQVNNGGKRGKRKLPRLIRRNRDRQTQIWTHRNHITSNNMAITNNNRTPRQGQDTDMAGGNVGHQEVSLRVRPRQSFGSSGKLVYLDRSPNFCRRSRWWVGTSGRECQAGVGCKNLCCGRGYHSAFIRVTEPCRCRVVWCCSVECHTCTSLTHTHTCK